MKKNQLLEKLWYKLGSGQFLTPALHTSVDGEKEGRDLQGELARNEELRDFASARRLRREGLRKFTLGRCRGGRRYVNLR